MSYQPKLQQQAALAKFDDYGASRRQDTAVKDLLQQQSAVAPAAAAHDVIYEPEHQAADWSGFVAKVGPMSNA
jgi:hypothetical protein